jgi:formylglycine-generating enzyme required for sulfatase activity
MLCGVGGRVYAWRDRDGEHELRLVHVPGTNGKPFLFGTGADRRSIHVRGFFIGVTPVTQALWTRVMGANPSAHKGPEYPVENVSWDAVVGCGGFLDRINDSEILAAIAGEEAGLTFRLPSETEWEYAARGGPHWTDRCIYSGSNDADTVAWYGSRWSPARRLGTRMLGPRLGWHIFGRQRLRYPTRTHQVATKAPNGLGIYDMSGNVWEWCQDTCSDDIEDLPRDGTPYSGEGPDRRLRGGSHMNWDIHCTVSFRYGIARDAHDGCIGFRLVLGDARPAIGGP